MGSIMGSSLHDKPVRSIYFWSLNLSQLAYEKSEVKMLKIGVQNYSIFPSCFYFFLTDRIAINVSVHKTIIIFFNNIVLQSLSSKCWRTSCSLVLKCTFTYQTN